MLMGSKSPVSKETKLAQCKHAGNERAVTSLMRIAFGFGVLVKAH